jgi:N-acyl-D-amino-acid deacylase
MKRLFVIVLTLAATSAAADNPPIFDAIRNGDIALVKNHLTKADLESRGARGTTPLLYAAAFGDLETLRILLEAGADVNRQNDLQASALLWAACQPEKARLLLERGAEVNIQSKQGRTPLIVAAACTGNAEIVRLMLSKGADVKVRDRLGMSALRVSARTGDLDTVKLLLGHGADPNAADFLGRTSLFVAMEGRNPEVVRLLLKHGAKVNIATAAPADPSLRTVNIIKNGPPSNSGVTPLHQAAAYGPVESVRLLLQAGANVNARDVRQLAPLTFALATEYASPEIVGTLIQAGADLNVADNFGDTPLDWAKKFGKPSVIAELKRAGAKEGRAYSAPGHPDQQRPEAAIALERATRLLEPTSKRFFEGSGCVSCHHQNYIARAQAAAKRAGIPQNDAAIKEQTLQMKTQWVSSQDDFLQMAIPGGGADRLAENLLGLKAAEYPADSITDATVAAIAVSQEPDGHWRTEVQIRPPVEQSPFAATARVIRALRDYSIPARRPEFESRIARAREWLAKAKPVTSEDFSMRLAGLKQSGAADREVTQATQALLALQHADGGWSANENMDSDAYMTGIALTVLAESKVIKVTDRPYKRGIEYLLSTQFPDGSWHVRSRSIKVQPYFESGFPFGHDQWISTAATAWAVQAIALSMEPSAAHPVAPLRAGVVR